MHFAFLANRQTNLWCVQSKTTHTKIPLVGKGWLCRAFSETFGEKLVLIKMLCYRAKRVRGDNYNTKSYGSAEMKHFSLAAKAKQAEPFVQPLTNPASQANFFPSCGCFCGTVPHDLYWLFISWNLQNNRIPSTSFNFKFKVNFKCYKMKTQGHRIIER